MYFVITFFFIIYVVYKLKPKYDIVLSRERLKPLYDRIQTTILEYNYIHNLNGDKDKSGFQLDSFVIKKDKLLYYNNSINLPRRKCKLLFRKCTKHNNKFVKQRDQNFHNNKLNKLNEFIGD